MDRNDAEYRSYTSADRDRLDRICRFRQAGLSLGDIRHLLHSSGEHSVWVLEKRFGEIGIEILALKAKQGLLAHMLKTLSSDKLPSKVDKAMWVEILRCSAGMHDLGMERWHSAFEARAPEAHHEFLLSLGIPEPETREIRKWSGEFIKTTKRGKTT